MSLISALHEIDNPVIRFQADPLMAANLSAPPANISFNRPYHEGFETMQEGYFSLGQLPNPKDFEEVIEAEDEYCLIKRVGSLEFEVPEVYAPLIPFIKLTASFELAHTDNFKQKSCTIILRDHYHFSSKPAEELHRDPPEREVGRAQNVYAITTNNPTIFPDFQPVKPFEMICFTAASPHYKPAVDVTDPNKPVRRVFAALAYDFNPGDQPRPWLGQGGIVHSAAQIMRGMVPKR